MYENLTFEEVKSNILSRMSTDIDVREGSFTNDMISAVAYEIWKAYQTLDAVISVAFVDETSGEYIDKRCAEYGITRKAGTRATSTLTITGANGTVIPKGKVFLTVDGLQFITDNNVTIAGGNASITATAAEVGEDYNVAAGTILRQFANISGIVSVTNLEASGGTNKETDDALFTRLITFLSRPSTSGNVADYKNWALEVSGCGGVKVFPIWNGPGTVKLLVVDANKEIDNGLPDKVYEYIETMRPIGATVTVYSPSTLSINTSANIKLDGTKTLEEVQAAFSSVLSEHLKTMVFESYSISYARVGGLLLSTEGVEDYDTLLLNNGTSNITIGGETIPVPGSVVLTEVA